MCEHKLQQSGMILNRVELNKQKRKTRNKLM